MCLIGSQCRMSICQRGSEVIWGLCSRAILWTKRFRLDHLPSLRPGRILPNLGANLAYIRLHPTQIDRNTVLLIAAKFRRLRKIRIDEFVPKGYCEELLTACLANKSLETVKLTALIPREAATVDLNASCEEASKYIDKGTFKLRDWCIVDLSKHKPIWLHFDGLLQFFPVLRLIDLPIHIGKLSTLLPALPHLERINCSRRAKRIFLDVDDFIGVCMSLRVKCPKLGLNITVCKRSSVIMPDLGHSDWPPSMDSIITRLEQADFDVPIHVDLILSLFSNGWKIFVFRIPRLIQAIDSGSYPRLFPSIPQLLQTGQWDVPKMLESALKHLERHVEILSEMIRTIATAISSIDSTGVSQRILSRSLLHKIVSHPRHTRLLPLFSGTKPPSDEAISSLSDEDVLDHLYRILTPQQVIGLFRSLDTDTSHDYYMRDFLPLAMELLEQERFAELHHVLSRMDHRDLDFGYLSLSEVNIIKFLQFCERKTSDIEPFMRLFFRYRCVCGSLVWMLAANAFGASDTLLSSLSDQEARDFVANRLGNSKPQLWRCVYGLNKVMDAAERVENHEQMSRGGSFLAYIFSTFIDSMCLPSTIEDLSNVKEHFESLVRLAFLAMKLGPDVAAVIVCCYERIFSASLDENSPITQRAEGTERSEVSLAEYLIARYPEHVSAALKLLMETLEREIGSDAFDIRCEMSAVLINTTLKLCKAETKVYGFERILAKGLIKISRKVTQPVSWLFELVLSHFDERIAHLEVRRIRHALNQMAACSDLDDVKRLVAQAYARSR